MDPEHAVPAFLTGLEPLVPELRHGGEAALQAQEAKPLRRAFDLLVPAALQRLGDAPPEDDGRPFELSREEPLVVHTQGREAAVDDGEVLFDRDRHDPEVYPRGPGAELG